METIKLKLKIAKTADLITLDKYVMKKGKKTKKWKTRTGFPYWIMNSKGKIENKNYILNEHTDMKYFSELLVREQIYIPK